MNSTLRTLVRYGYLPIMLIGVNGAGIALAAGGTAKTWLLTLLGGSIAASFGAERLLPYDLSWNDDHGDTGRDVAHALINESLILVSVAAIPLLAALPDATDRWPRRWAFPVQVALAVGVADLGITLVHLASHKIEFVWRFHAVHHSVKRFYGFNGLMKHPVHQTVEMIGGVAPLLLAGMPVDVASALALAIAVQLLLQHSNVDYRAGWFTHVLALNEGHRFHHLKWAGVGDVNFGLFTLVWDHLLGTYSYDPRRRFSSDDLGMDAEPNYPTRYLPQLRAPFTSHNRTPGSGKKQGAATAMAARGEAQPRQPQLPSVEGPRAGPRSQPR
jgi:sterol desaturase/sphingolipid hydroxylase (fatty acid hydroxylase superfamily)